MAEGRDAGDGEHDRVHTQLSPPPRDRRSRQADRAHGQFDGVRQPRRHGERVATSGDEFKRLVEARDQVIQSLTFDQWLDGFRQVLTLPANGDYRFSDQLKGTLGIRYCSKPYRIFND